MITWVVLASALSVFFGDLPEGTDPGTVSRRVTDQFLTTRPENYKPAGYFGNEGYGWNRIVQYSVVSAWLNGIACARLTGDDYRKGRLIALFEDFLPGGRLNKVASRPWHVDDTIFGALPLEIYLANQDARCRDMGLFYADNQWCAPCEASFKERESAPPDLQRDYYRNGYSVQTRLWIDDMYMITVLQSQAYRVTKDRKYIERAAKEMCLYLDELQLKDGPAKGLFYHAPDVPYVWARGAGWMAAGMALVLDRLPEDSPHFAKIKAGYLAMMETLLKYQREDGFWCQLVDRPDERENWPETSGTAMFTYAFVTGISRGWLDGAKYGPSARKAYLALCSKFDVYGNIAGVCEGTSKKNDLPYYYARRKVNGDPHGQAPMLWIASVLLREGIGVTGGTLRTPETSKLFERRVDPVSKVVSYSLCHGAPDDNRQSLYFVTKSMTEDGRFLVFNYTRGNERKKGMGPRVTMVADLLKDEISEIGQLPMTCPFVDCKNDYIVYGDQRRGFFRVDLANPGPSNAVKLCDSPPEFVALGGGSLATHLTLTTDRRKAFLDAILRKSGVTTCVQGLLDLKTGKFERWNSTTEFEMNHGQLNPVRDDLALCAWEGAWLGPGRAYQRKTGHYPRMWLMEPGGRRTLVPAKDRNFASHEIWDDDGRGFSWCGNGMAHEIYHHDLATGAQECVMPLPGARHNTLSPDLKYVVYDNAPEKWWRGCKWRVGFYNRETGRNVWVYSTRPALMPENNQSKLHPDPHPHFVMKAKYIVSTANNADGHMDLFVTPVDQLIEMTSCAEREGQPQTAALQSRIDGLAAKGGGTLTLEPGVHRSGSLFFKPGVNLHLEKGATLLGVDDGSAYPMRDMRIEGRTISYYSALINADRCDGFRISGEGVIDGHGLPTWKACWDWIRKDSKSMNVNMPPGVPRPQLVYVTNSRDVDVSGVTIRNSKFWTVHFYRCRNVRVHDCTVVAEILDGVKGPCADGIDFDVCSDCTVSNAYLNVNDDAVCLKSNKGVDADDLRKRPDGGLTENVLVTDCTFGGMCHSCLTLGSELTHARNVVMRSCKVEGADIFLHLKMRVDTPQRYEHVLVENCRGSVKRYFCAGAWSQMTVLDGREPPPSVAQDVILRGNDVSYGKFSVLSDQPFVRYVDFDVAVAGGECLSFDGTGKRTR